MGKSSHHLLSYHLCTCIHEARDGQNDPDCTNHGMTFLNTAVLSHPSTVLSAIDLFLKLYSSWNFQGLHEATGADFCGKLSSVPVETRGGQSSLGAAVTQKASLPRDYGRLSQNKEEDVSEKKGCGDNIYWLPAITIVLTLGLEMGVITPLLQVRKLRPVRNIFLISPKLY